MVESNAYYRRRSEEELDAAEKAADSAISQIHREMAQRYRDLVSDELDRMSDVAEPGTIPA